MKHVNSTTQSASEIQIEVVVYAFSHCETWIEDYAKSHQLPAHELTRRVAALLLAQTSGALLGTVNNLPTLRGPSPKGDKTTRKMAMVGRPRGKAQVKTKLRRAPTAKREVECKVCGEKILNVQMGNHMRYSHPRAKAA